MKCKIVVLYLLISSAQLYAQNVPRIINGIVIPEETYPQAFRISTDFGAFRAGCTASAVSDNTVLTAAHCITDSSASPRSYEITTGASKGAVSRRALVHPIYASNMLRNDIALVIFAANTFTTWFTLADVMPEVGQEFVIIGYGKTQHIGGTFDNLKRMGFNVLARVGLRLDFYGAATTSSSPHQQGSNSANAQGDSGGPLLIDEFVVGVSSSVDTNLTADGKVHAHYENLLHIDNLNFLRNSNTQGARVSGLHSF